MEEQNLGDLLRSFRKRTINPKSGKPLTQEELAEELDTTAELPGYTNVNVSFWETNARNISGRDGRTTIKGLIKVYVKFNGLTTLEEANKLLEKGEYRDLTRSEIKSINPEWLSEASPRPIDKVSNFLGGSKQLLFLVAVLVIFSLLIYFQQRPPKFRIPNNASNILRDDFSTTSGENWSIHRDAGGVGFWANDAFTLVPGDQYQYIRMYADYSLTGTHWIASFLFKTDTTENCSCGDCGGDGFVFGFYQNSELEGFEKAQLIGFSGTGYGIEFDTFFNTGVCSPGNDPVRNHVALIAPGEPYPVHLIAVQDDRVEDGRWHRVIVEFINGLVNVAVDNDRLFDFLIENPSFQYTGVGFSAASGQAANIIMIDDFIIFELPSE